MATVSAHAAPPATASWKTKVAEAMPLLGHRNWILIVDSAYPQEVSPGIETVETGEGEIDVARYVLGVIGGSIHVRPDFYMDAELPFVPDADAPGASAYRAAVGKLLRGDEIVSEPHAKLLADIDQSGKVFRVLVLKTTSTVPYSSIFIRLDCKYWSADAEQRLRARMAAAHAPVQ